MSDLENMTLLELRNFAKEQNIRNISKLKKEELAREKLGMYLQNERVYVDSNM